MTGALFALLAIGLLAVGLVVVAAGIFNRLVVYRNRYKNAFSQIEVQLKRRHDLIPNLVEVAKGYLKHERETLEAVIAARNSAVGGLQRALRDPGNAAAMKDLAATEAALAGTIGRLFAVMEAYPDLKGNQNMLGLSEELRSTENKIAFARQAFNDSVTEYNTYKQTFPTLIFAALFGQGQDASHLEFDAAIQKAPQISF